MTRTYWPVTNAASRAHTRRAHLAWHHVIVAVICVFCGSNSGFDARHADVAHRLGESIAADGHTLVYGGGHVGLMGVVADATLGAGGTVVGVMTEQLVAAEVAHRRLTSLEIVGSMHERKARMAELATGVIVMPGGFGTLDEAFEIMTWNQLGLVTVPVVFLDVVDYFHALFQFVDAAVAAGFVTSHHARLAQRASTVQEALALATTPAAPQTSKWLR
jgi:uncharacterized protein (TIGR00730 family)